MKILSEFLQNNRRAEVVYREDHKDYVGIGYENNLQKASSPFSTESDCEDWCEDWIFG